MRQRLAAVVVSVGFLASCGLRSDFEGDNLRVEPTGSAATCTDPIELPTFDSVSEGTLAGVGQLTDSCASTEGPEHIYRLSAVEHTTVNVVFSASTSSNVSARVLASPCRGGPVLDCSPSAAEGALQFDTSAGVDYFIVVDSERANEVSDYAMRVSFGSAVEPDTSCVTESQVLDLTDDTSVLYGQLGAGSGQLDSACGGPGIEDVVAFELPVGYSGVAIQLVADASVISSIRTTCGAGGELTCSAHSAESFEFVEYDLAPGLYLLAIDAVSTAGADYALAVSAY